MDERMRFVIARAEGAENMSDLCRHFGISRKTGYKWWQRYVDGGVAGLADLSRAPLRNPRAVDPARIAAILAVRHRHPTWGPRKVKAWLERHQAAIAWPAASTIGALFDAHGLTRPRKKRHRTPPHGRPFAACNAPNDVWCADFKGWFVTGDGIKVDPFTLSDAHSRYLLRLDALGRPDEAHVWSALQAAFEDFGLPRTLRTDNGPPFASRAAAGLSRLAVKLIKAGVRPERIQPGKPQQNGRHERLHLTLKQDTASPPAASLKAQMDRFCAFQQTYNEDRPHEALGQRPPDQLYRPSPRRFDGQLRSPEYDAGVKVRKVRQSGEIKWQGETLYISTVLKGEPIGLYPIAEDTWLAKYGPVVLGTIKGSQGLVKINPNGGCGCVDKSEALSTNPQQQQKQQP